jgi:hypothetical protein
MIGDLPAGVVEPRVGDEILVRGVVSQWVPGVGVLVELFSKTDQYETWIRPDLIAEVVVPNLPNEPADGTWLLGRDPYSENARVFRRDDAEGHCDAHRRHDQHWRDVVAEEWIDWPQVIRRGAPLQVMQVMPS